MLLNFADSIQQLDSVGEMRPGFHLALPHLLLYEHLTALSRRISPFRHGAGVGLKGRREQGKPLGGEYNGQSSQ